MDKFKLFLWSSTVLQEMDGWNMTPLAKYFMRPLEMNSHCWTSW